MSSVSVSPVVVEDKKSKAVRNSLLGSAAGAIAGGGAGYFATKLVKDGAPTDKFIHTMTQDFFCESLKKATIMQQSALMVQLDKIKDLLKIENLTPEELKSFLEKNKKHFKYDLENFNNGKVDETVLKFDKIIKKYNKNFEKLKKGLTQTIDTTEGKMDFSKLAPKFRLSAEAAEFFIKAKNCAKYGAIAAAGLGIISFIATKIKERNE